MADTSAPVPAAAPKRAADRKSLRKGLSWRARLAFLIVVTMAMTVVWFTNSLLTERFTENTRTRAQVRLALYSGNMLSELQRASIVPLLLSRDPALIGALNSSDFSQSTQRLISYREEIEAASLMLLDTSGRVVAATDRTLIGSTHRNASYFVEALRASGTVFTTSTLDAGVREFSYTRKIETGGETAGVIVVGVDLKKFESSWAGFSDAVLVTDSEGEIILATESRWRGLTEEEALEVRSAPSAIQRAIQVTADWAALPIGAYVQGEAVMRKERRVPFQRLADGSLSRPMQACASG